MPDIDVQNKYDAGETWITGQALLSADKLLLVDYNNSCIKKADTVNKKVTSRLPVSHNPWDVTVLPQNVAAVTLPFGRRIQMISTKRGLSAVGTLTVDGICRGIASIKYRLVVSYEDPSKVEIMDFYGNVFACAITSRAISPLIPRPNYVCVAEENSLPVIYVSEFISHCVTKLSLGGQVLATYKHKNWRGLEGLQATKDGQLLVCNREYETVDVVSEDGKNIQTLLDSSHELDCPQSLCFSEDNNTLYVSSISSLLSCEQPVKVFQVIKQ